MSNAHARFLAAKNEGKPIAIFHQEQASSNSAMGASTPQKFMRKTGHDVQKDPTVPVSFDDILQQHKEDGKDLTKVVKLFKRFLHQEFPPETAGIVG